MKSKNGNQVGRTPRKFSVDMKTRFHPENFVRILFTSCFVIIWQERKKTKANCMQPSCRQSQSEVTIFDSVPHVFPTLFSNCIVTMIKSTSTKLTSSQKKQSCSVERIQRHKHRHRHRHKHRHKYKNLHLIQQMR